MASHDEKRDSGQSTTTRLENLEERMARLEETQPATPFERERLRAFLIRQSEDPDARNDLFANADDALRKAEISDRHRKILVSGDAERIYELILDAFQTYQGCGMVIPCCIITKQT